VGLRLRPYTDRVTVHSSLDHAYPLMLHASTTASPRAAVRSESQQATSIAFGIQSPFSSCYTSLKLQTADGRPGSPPRKEPCPTEDAAVRTHSMDTQKRRPDAGDLRDAHTCNTLTEACERLIDIPRKAGDLRSKLVERGPRYERTYHSEHHKLLLITAAQKTPIVENKRLKHEIEHLRRSARPRYTLMHLQFPLCTCRLVVIPR
jgi:hypothetical protein